ncbi:MAG TPA: M3 family metallopeptidase [Rubrivivax sp.]|nr:M3 family metallopeptidase [Rubrivivax sp.]
MEPNATVSADAQALLAPWPGPYGGLPPLAGVRPVAIEDAMRAAIEMKRAEVRAIAANPAPPTFENTAEALEACGAELRRVSCVHAVYAASMSVGDMPAVAQSIAPWLTALDDEIAHEERLFARLNAVWASRAEAGLSPEQQRLVEVLRTRLQRRGAGLPRAAQARLAAINSRLATLSAGYSQNLIDEAGAQAVFIDDASGLDGLPDALRTAAAAAAAEKGRPGQWAIPNARGAVWPFLTLATRRDLREQVWRMWTNRGDDTGPQDNKPVAAEILQLRGELARLMGFPSYAHFALADRMAGTPATALALLERTWASVKPRALAQIADYQAMADREGAGIRLAPWDRQFYAEKLRQERFGLDGDAVKAHFPLDAVLQALFWAAGRVHGLAFKPIAEAPLIHPTVRVYEVSRGDEVIGVIYFDLFNRPGKAHGSYQTQYREAEHFRGRVLPISGVYSTFPPPPGMDQGQPVLLPWEYANVFFHEFGHALHMLHCTSAYRSLGSQHVAWDFVELPALINERWLRDRELLARFARHHVTGESIAPAMVDRIEQGQQYDRIFSLNPDFLLPAIVDMRLHLRADGSGQPIDPVQVENETLAELGMPEAWDLIMRVTHNFHIFSGGYAAGLYSYLWADVMAADAVEAFERSPGGLYDEGTARRWIDQILSVGHRVPADQAFRNFADHAPDPVPLQRRFGLQPSA